MTMTRIFITENLQKAVCGPLERKMFVKEREGCPSGGYSPQISYQEDIYPDNKVCNELESAGDSRTPVTM